CRAVTQPSEARACAPGGAHGIGCEGMTDPVRCIPHGQRTEPVKRGVTTTGEAYHEMVYPIDQVVQRPGCPGSAGSKALPSRSARGQVGQRRSPDAVGHLGWPGVTVPQRLQPRAPCALLSGDRSMDRAVDPAVDDGTVSEVDARE